MVVDISAPTTERRRIARFVCVAAATALVVFAADGLSKTLVAATYVLGEARELVPGWLVLTHVRNTGTAYGFLADQGWVVLPLSVIASLVVPVVLWRGGFWRGRPTLGGLSAGLIVGGALGNLIERLQQGAVTDFVHVPHIPLFQVFNVADASICTGAVLVLVLGWMEGRD